MCVCVTEPRRRRLSVHVCVFVWLLHAPCLYLCVQHRSEAQNSRLIELLSSITLEMDTTAVITKVRA